MKRVKIVVAAWREAISSILGSVLSNQGTCQSEPGANSICMSTQRCTELASIGPCLISIAMILSIQRIESHSLNSVLAETFQQLAWISA